MKNVGEGCLKDITQLIVETDEENPVPVVIITADNIDIVNCGYRVRLTPNYDT
jgi:hypothetical protein